MFDRIAGPYDLMNRVMTAGLDRRWRALAARESGVGRGATVLDACCGTGDLALELARVVGPQRPGDRARLLGRDAARGPRARSARDGRGGDRVGARRRDGDAVRRQLLRRRDDRASACATCPTPRPACASSRASCARAGASSASRSRSRVARPLKQLLLALVRPRHPGPRQGLRPRRRLLLPARLGAPLPGPRRARRGLPPRRHERRPLPAAGRRHRRPARRRGRRRDRRWPRT